MTNETPQSFLWKGPGTLEPVAEGRVFLYYPGDIVDNPAHLAALGPERIALFLSNGAGIPWPPPAGTVLDDSELRDLEMPRSEQGREEERAFTQASRDKTSSTIANTIAHGEKMRALEVRK